MHKEIELQNEIIVSLKESNTYMTISDQLALIPSQNSQQNLTEIPNVLQNPQYEENFELILKTLPTLTTKLEIEEIIKSINIKIKDTARHQGVADDITEKLNEFEQRLNGF